MGGERPEARGRRFENFRFILAQRTPRECAAQEEIRAWLMPYWGVEVAERERRKSGSEGGDGVSRNGAGSGLKQDG